MAIGFNQSGVAFDSTLYTFDGASLAPPAAETTFLTGAYESDSRAQFHASFRVGYDQTTTATWRE